MAGVQPSGGIEEPLDLVRLALNELVRVRLRGQRELRGDCMYVDKSPLNVFADAFDQHLNMILGDVEETTVSVEVDEETFEEIITTERRKFPMLFVRGDTVVLISPGITT